MDARKLDVMADVQQVWLFMMRNVSLIAIMALCSACLAVLLALALPPSYAGRAMIMLDPRKTHVTGLEAVVSGLPAESAAVRSEIDIIKSRAVLDRVIADRALMQDSLFTAPGGPGAWLEKLLAGKEGAASENRQRSYAAERLLKNLTVAGDGRSYSIAITYRDRDPQKAAAIANAFADQYLADQLDAKYGVSRRANDWLASRLDGLRREVAVSEKAVEDYRRKHNLVGAGDETITQQQLGAINAQLLQARAGRAEAEARFSGVKGLKGAKLETASAVQASPLISQLKQQEAEVRRKEADLATRYGNRHPMMIKTRNELRSIRDKIGEEATKIASGLKNDITAAEGKVRGLEKELARLEGKTGEGNQAMVALRQLQREAAATRSLYEGFLTRFKQVAEQQDMQMADARIIARADVPVRPFFPDPLVFLVLGIAGGLVLGLVTALLVDYLDKGFRALGPIEKTYGVPGLGITPVAKTGRNRKITDYILEKPVSVYAEAIRAIHAALRFSNGAASPKVVMAASALPGEGKTLFSASLARLLAKAGGSVLLIDADMRRSRLYALLNLDPARPGLAAVLAGDAAMEAAIQKDASGADVIISSGIPANPHDLLASEAMERLVAAAREKYETVIIDTPPVMAVADALVLSRLADATVFIVRWAATPREVAGESLKRLQDMKVRLGVVLTQVDLAAQKQYGYGDYGYYHGYYKNYYVN